MTKKQKLINLFEKVNSLTVYEVLTNTGILTLGSLKVICVNLRKEGINLELTNGRVNKRVNKKINPKLTVKRVVNKVNNPVKRVKKRVNKKIIVLKSFVLLISIGCIIYSMYYSSLWFSKYLNNIGAYVFAFLLVSFSAISPALGGIFWKKSKIIAIILYASFLCVLFLSIFSTIAGQYRSNPDIRLRVKKIENLKLTELKEEQRELKVQLNNYQFELTKNRSKYKTSNIPVQRRLAYFKHSINRILNQLKVNRKEIKLILSKNVYKEKEGFFDWLSNIIGLSKEGLEFWLYMLPAIFIDIIAPIGFLSFFKSYQKRRNK